MVGQEEQEFKRQLEKDCEGASTWAAAIRPAIGVRLDWIKEWRQKLRELRERLQTEDGRSDPEKRRAIK